VPRILVADDNSNIHKMVANALKEQGIEVVGVANGDAAIKRIPDLKPDMVLADVFMPVRDGYELCEWVKKQEQFAELPVFLLVGAFDPIDEHRVQAVHADGLIKKPFVPPDDLILKVKLMLERAAQTRADAAARAAQRQAHDQFAASVPSAEETQKLTDQEVAELTGRHAAPPAPPEPEMEEYATRPPRVEFGEAEKPVAFGEFLESADDEETSSVPPFQASAVTGVDAPRSYAEPEPGVPPDERSYGIAEEMRKPSPDEPPIKVDFSAPSEPAELVTEDRSALGATLDVAPAPDLVASGHDIGAEVAPPKPAVAPPPPSPEISLAPEPPPAPAWSAPPPPVGIPPVVPAAPPVNPYVVDEIVDRVLSRLQPQIVHQISSEVGKALTDLHPQVIDRLTREVLRPAVEELLRDAAKK
jgi:CheY-like chemotaxis protein